MPFPTDDAGAEYVFRCLHTPTCDPLNDEHGHECRQVNDEARTEFYEDVVARDFGLRLLRGLGMGLVALLLLTGCGDKTVCTTYPSGTVACQTFPAPLDLP